MIGFIVGGMCLAMLISMVRRAYWHRASWRGRAGGWRRYALYSLFERLDATPGQEKVITQALDELRETMRAAREKFDDVRREAASTFRQPHVGEEDTNRIGSHFDEHLETLRQAAGKAMQKIHEALDEHQRAMLADMIERGFSFGGHRGHHGCGGFRRHGFHRACGAPAI